MDDDERTTPDSLTGKLHDLFDADGDEEAAEPSGRGILERDAGSRVPDGARDPDARPPKRPTDPPF